MIRIKRIYEPVQEADGKRILVDRLWPRGISKANAAVMEWMKELAPSHELRQWFHHEPAKFELFKEKYKEELRCDAEKMRLLEQLLQWSNEGTVTLLYAAKDAERNQAVVLAEMVGDEVR